MNTRAQSEEFLVGYPPECFGSTKLPSNREARVMAKGALGPRRLLHGRWRPFLDCGGCSRTTETPPRTVETPMDDGG